MLKKFNCVFILIILFTLYIFVCAHSYSLAISKNLSDSVFRLHIIANSDSEEDQKLKLTVRDALLNYMNELCKNCSTKQEVIQLATQHQEDFKKIAEKVIKEEGFSYSVNIEIGKFEIPTKTYGDISFPAGYYDALRVEIGESSGQNWWCVMFPPLCFIDTSTGIVSDESKETLQNSLSDESYKIISNTDTSSITLKFKIIELFKQTGLITAKNN